MVAVMTGRVTVTYRRERGPAAALSAGGAADAPQWIVTGEGDRHEECLDLVKALGNVFRVRT